MNKPIWAIRRTFSASEIPQIELLKLEKRRMASQTSEQSWLKPPRHSQAGVCILEKSFPSRALTPYSPTSICKWEKGAGSWEKVLKTRSPTQACVTCVTSHPIPSPFPFCSPGSFPTLFPLETASAKQLLPQQRLPSFKNKTAPSHLCLANRALLSVTHSP